MASSYSSKPTPRVVGEPRSAEPHAGAEGATRLELLFRSLLDASDVAETERRVVEAIRSLASARWVACFREEASSFVCRAVDGTGPMVGETLSCEAEPLATLCAGGAVVPAAEVGLEAYTGGGSAALLPLQEGVRTLLLIGPRDGEGDGAEVVARALDGCRAALQNAHLLERLRSQVFVDFLTACYNRRGFEDHLRVEMVRARRYRRPLSLMLLDVDHFKRINDTLGHLAGDHVLRKVGEALRGAFRTTDVVCRFGGDEFAVIFPETPREEIVRLAERVRVQIAALFPDAEVERVITASLGVAGFPADAGDSGALVEAADRALYTAKAEGRNRISVAAPAA